MTSLRAATMFALAILVAGCSGQQAPATSSSVPGPSQSPGAAPTSTLVAPTATNPSATTAPTPAATVEVAPSVTPEPAGSPSTASALTIQDCASTATPASICLGPDPGSAAATVAKGGVVTLSMTLKNETTTTSTPYTVLLYQLDPGPWPFASWSCSQCNAYAKVPAIGFGWRALAPGESRTVTIKLTASTQPTSTIWFTSLYAQPLADVEAAAVTGGFVPGVADWKIQATITP
jgi:hypothetical protein